MARYAKDKRQHSKKVKVISIIFEEENDDNCSRNIIEVANRSIGLLCRELSNYEMEGSDFTIKIKSKKVGLLDMSKMDELYNLGYEQTKVILTKGYFNTF